MKLSKIASLIGANFNGDDIEITAMNTLKDALSSELSFVSNSKYIKDIAHSKAAAIIVDENTKQYVPKNSVALIVEDTYWQMALLSKEFAPKIEDNDALKPIIGKNTVISSKAEIANGAVIGSNCTILASVYIGSGSIIGDNTVIYPNVVIYRDCKVGNDCIIHAGTVIGSDGFGFATTKLGTHVKIHQNGNVIVEDDVEIGASSTVDRAAFGTTWIKTGVRIDNLVQVGHNAIIGEYSVLVSQSGVAGSTELGRNVVFGGQTAAAGHLKIAPFTTFAARSGITHDVKESNKVYGGFPLMEQRQWLRLQAKIARLLKK